MEKPNKVSYIWASAGETTTVTWTLEEYADGTHLHFDQDGFSEETRTYPGAMKGAKSSWKEFEHQLEKVLEQSYKLSEEDIMEIFEGFLNKIDPPVQRVRVEEVLKWISENYPSLKPEVKWNQPMFTDHGTYIIGLSVAKNHLAIAPESAGITAFTEVIQTAGYTHTDNLFRIQWNQPVDYALLRKLIDFNIQDKTDICTFWR